MPVLVIILSNFNENKAVVDIKNAQTSTYKIESSLEQIISVSGQITEEIIGEFDNLIKNFENLANIFFKKFENKYFNQIIAFGAIKTTSEICKGLKNNLIAGHKSGENPIVAEKIIDKNYMSYIAIILESLGKVYDVGEINNEEFMSINESVRNLFKNSVQDKILEEKKVQFANKASEEMFLSMLRNFTNLKI